VHGVGLLYRVDVGFYLLVVLFGLLFLGGAVEVLACRLRAADVIPSLVFGCSADFRLK